MNAVIIGSEFNVDIKERIITFKTEEQLQKFLDYANNPNPSNEKIRKLLSEREPTQKKKTKKHIPLS